MLFFRHQVILGMACSALLLGGCGDASWNSTWKSTKGAYYSYVNTPASIDYSDTGNLSESEVLLADNMRPLDQTLSRFERFLANQDKPPTPESVSTLFSRYPWVTGVAAVSAEGEVLAKEPPTGLKNVDFAPILASVPLGERALRGDVQETPLGPEMLIGVPIFASSELKGYFVAHFDIRSLLGTVADPANLVILSPQMVLWPGQFSIEQTPLQGVNWKDATAGSVRGSVSNSAGSFLWVSRHVGGVPLIFAAPAKGSSFPTNPSQLAILDQLGVARRDAPLEEQDLIDAPAPLNAPASEPAKNAADESPISG